MTRIPLATYRLQCNSAFTLKQARQLASYLHSLGISDLYTSPLMKTGGDDLNGYEVTDPSCLNPRIGDENDLDALSAELQQYGMGLLLDIVPNHMAIAYIENTWWNDVLENGPSSSYAHYFDIDWQPPRLELVNKVLLPILGQQYGYALENQEIRVTYQEGSFVLNYYERTLPTDPCSWWIVLSPVVERAELLLAPGHVHLIEMQSIVTALTHLPSTTEQDPERVAERHREKEIIKRRLSVLIQESKEIAQLVDEQLQTLNGELGQAHSFDPLAKFLAQQPYRLAFWRVANHEINYRRFFDINDLAGLRVEQFDVFNAVHHYLFSLIRRKWVTGLRIDHVDGLFDPYNYLKELQKGAQIALEDNTLTPSDPDEKAIYTVVEKIFCGQEDLNTDWPVHGTTGYDFLADVGGLFIAQQNHGLFRKGYATYGLDQQNPKQLIFDCKQFTLEVSLAAELHVLARHLDRISEQSRYSRDFTLDNLQLGLADVISFSPVYRSYVQPQNGEITDEDRRIIRWAVTQAKRHNPATSALIFDFIQQILLLKEPRELDEEQLHERRSFVGRFQQLTGPVMAKGVEDTAFYRYYPLASINEVGSEIGHFGHSVEEFHAANLHRTKHWPHSLLATSTHDTKRSEDVRARLHVLSEIPDAWFVATERWRDLNQPHRAEIEGEVIPSPNEEYLLYQTLVGSYVDPVDDHQEYVHRIQRYMMKATKEAKVSTSWINPDNTFDQALHNFIARILHDPDNNPFVQDLGQFISNIAPAGYYNSLAQVVLKIAAPGVPDFYQGNEVWQFHLVDPDNRRPIDYSYPQEQLPLLLNQPRLLPKLCDHLSDGRLKLYITANGLHTRRRHAALFTHGGYLPIRVEGRRADHIVAFARLHEGKGVIAVVGRFFMEIGANPTGQVAWKDATLILPPELHHLRFRDIYSGQQFAGSTLPVADLFTYLPVALLEPVEEVI